METGDEAGANPRETGRHGRKWKTAERLVGALAALFAVAGGVAWGVQWISRDSPVEKEEKLVEQLRPGQTLERTTEIMDDKPHYSQRLESKNRIYQYNRKWERIQLLVDPDNITVLSVGIYADKKDFRPSFLHGYAHLTINRTTYEQALGDTEPSFVFANCGVHSGSYFEGYLGLGETAGASDIAVGVHDSFRGNVSMEPPCGSIQAAPEGCVPVALEVKKHPECLTSAPAGNFRKSTPIAALVLTKQLKLTDDMFQSPYVVAGGND
ncbi:hypothetical protein [Streptomyces sp. NPDC048527]|uniref:hypothetical protein n=2 Tax=unclassified Streptomyces TaxID=2593676 RepID=UPI00371A1CE8